MKTLYVTAGKTLYKVRTDIAGLPSERQRCDDRPRRQRAIVRTIGHASRDISKEAPCDSSHSARRRTRAVARRDAPGVLAIVAKAFGFRIAYCWFT
jgi:hypothetical protein